VHLFSVVVFQVTVDHSVISFNGIVTPFFLSWFNEQMCVKFNAHLSHLKKLSWTVDSDTEPTRTCTCNGIKFNGLIYTEC